MWIVKNHKQIINSKISPIATPGSHNRCPWGPSTSPNLGPSAKNLACTQGKGNIWSITIVRHTYRVIYITSPSQNLKNLENLSRTTPGNQNLLLEQQVPVQTSVQALRTLFVHRRRGICGPFWLFHILVELFISPAPLESRKSRKSVQNDPREPKPSPWAITTWPNLGPSDKNLVYIW